MGLKVVPKLHFFKVAKRSVCCLRLLVIIVEDIRIDYVDMSSVYNVKTLLPYTQGFQRQVKLR